MRAREINRTSERVGEATDVFLKQKKVEKQLKAQEVYNGFEREMITKLNDDRNSRMTNPTGFTKDFDGYISKRQEELETEHADKIDQQYFRQIMERDRNSYFAKNTDWENGIRGQNVFVGTEQTLDQMNSNFAMSNPDFNTFKDHSEKVRNYVNEVGKNVFSPEDSHKLAAYGFDGAASQFMDYKLQTDPESLKQVMRYGTGNKEGLIDFVMNDLEGGGKVVSDGNGTAKYGINSEHNKGVDVKALTEDKAKEIYRSKYWDARLDKFDPAFRAVAFDALVQHGNDKDTWRMIDVADGDPYSLIAMRQNYYKTLAEQNPEKNAKNLKGWENRMAKLTGFVKTMEGGGSDFIKQTSLIDPKIIGGTLDKLDTAIAQKKRLDAAHAKEATEASEVEQIVNQQEM
ncbi:MAG: glycosyl hydrolase 108 family protein, partial [Haliea sp.]